MRVAVFRDPDYPSDFAPPFLLWLLTLSLGYSMAAVAPVTASACRQDGEERGQGKFNR